MRKKGLCYDFSSVCSVHCLSQGYNNKLINTGIEQAYLLRNTNQLSYAAAVYTLRAECTNGDYPPITLR